MSSKKVEAVEPPPKLPPTNGIRALAFGKKQDGRSFQVVNHTLEEPSDSKSYGRKLVRNIISS